MTEPSLVELIEAYERAIKAEHEWDEDGCEPSEGDSPGDVAYDAERALHRRLMRPGIDGVAWKGSVYRATLGYVVVIREVRPADEIDETEVFGLLERGGSVGDECGERG